MKKKIIFSIVRFDLYSSIHIGMNVIIVRRESLVAILNENPS